MIDMDGPCICPGDPDHAQHPGPCGAPNSTDRVIELAETLGAHLDPWQRWVVKRIYGAHGRPALRTARTTAYIATLASPHVAEALADLLETITRHNRRDNPHGWDDCDGECIDAIVAEHGAITEETP